uniref:Peptidase S8/S53 domain-containing protein n=1 Tax=Amphimedon queenslandica TaxID=400682 RepID=A0A1X7SWX5_AMPQE
AVIDQEFSPKDRSNSEEINKEKEYHGKEKNKEKECHGKEINKEKEYHGEMCFKVIENIAPDAIIKKILDDGAIVFSIKKCLGESSLISLEESPPISLEENPPVSLEESPPISLEESSSVCLEESQPIGIISCSMGTESFDLHVCKAVNEAIAKGKIVVFSAGNKGQKSRNSILYPGRIGNVLVIGGQDPYNSHLSFSSVGKEIDFLAPAEYGGHKGTSYAAPAIAGHIALLLEFIKKMSEEDYRIIAWSYDSNLKKYRWQEISIWKAAHNVFAVRDLLKLFVSKPQPHSE